MKVLTYTSYKKHLELYTEIPGLIDVNSFQIELTRKDIKLLSDVILILYKAGLRTGVQDIHTKCSLSAGTYSINGFNTKVKEAVFQQRQIKLRTYSCLYESIRYIGF